jgi:tetratricopeptide (TPR) repeat protein
MSGRLAAVFAIAILGLSAQEPQTAEEWQRLGLTRHLQNQYAEAIPAFRRALRLNPRLWTADLFLGVGLYRTNQFREALAALERASRGASGAGRDEVDYWLGATRIALRQPLAGLQALESLLARQPNHADALELAARTYRDFSSALWNDVAEHHFETPQGYHVHGFALEGEGDAEGALEAFGRAQTLAATRPGPGREIGRIQLQRGQVAKARAVLDGEAVLAPVDPGTQHLRGLTALREGRLDDAVRALEIAVRWSSFDAEPATALAQALLGRQQFREAAAAAARAVELAPDSLAAHELLIAALTQGEDRQLAEAESVRWQQRRVLRESPRGAGTPGSRRP